MLSVSDLINLSFTADLSQAGIQYACQSLTSTSTQDRDKLYPRLRRLVAEKAAALAFIRHLNSERIPYELVGSTPFSEPNHFDITLGGRRCNIQVQLLHRKAQIRSVRRQPSQLLETQAAVSADKPVGTLTMMMTSISSLS